MFIAWRDFAITGGLALALAVGILAFNRTAVGYSKQVRAVVSAILAFGFAPTVWSPYGKAYVEAAALAILSGMIGVLNFPWVLLLGVAPWFVVFILVYGVWNRVSKRERKS